MVRFPSSTGGGAAAGVTSVARTVARACRVTGVVQGVGFRPFLHRLAVRHGLAGWTRNEAGEVRLVVEGGESAIARFLEELRSQAPPLARIQGLDVTPIPVERRAGFRVMASGAVDPARRLPLPPDVAVCHACLEELFDPANRRYRYPFITCTDCGPRFTVIEDLPYERARTSMRTFLLCPACAREFETPADRRFHSETNSCPACGPRLWVETGTDRADRTDKTDDTDRTDGTARDYGAAIAEAAALLLQGKIVALRGLGGFHLAADATSQAAVERLRARKRREAKPLAVMVRDVREAATIGFVGQPERTALLAPERPIVLLRASPGGVAGAVYPGLDQVGVMLAYTPLHHLLLERAGRPLVMTSGNLSEEPIAAGLDEARDRLGDIADAFLMHDREIVTRCDDSVVRPTPGGPLLLRRARGYAPLPLDLPVASPRPLLAVGPHLKNTATLVHGRAAFITPHVGDLENYETLEHFRHLTGSFRRLFHVDPEVVVHDLHPGYLSTRVAEESGLPLIAVQHHHAHIAAVLAEHGRTDRVVGLAFDGTGYGTDGAVWGAEVLVADLGGFERVGHMRYAPLPGGDLASRAPWRAALGYLSLEPERAPAFRLAFAGLRLDEVELARLQIPRGLNSPLASSRGRLFDAAAAVLGLRRVSRYEGQAAMELEAAARRHDPGRRYPFPVGHADGRFQLNPLPLLAALGERRAAGIDVADLAADFHASVAAAAVRVARWSAALAGVTTVALGGGTFQNARLLSLVEQGLTRAGLVVLTARRLGPNDGAISYGQAGVGAWGLANGSW